jgi:hypothetical protein
LYPEFFESDDTSTLSPLAALTYSGLWVISDDEGRGRLSAGFIHHRLHARRPGITEADTSGALKELANRGLIVSYSHPALYYIPSFRKHQRPRFPTPSKLPPPPTTVALQEGNGNTTVVLGDVDIDIDLDVDLGERRRQVADAPQPLPAAPPNGVISVLEGALAKSANGHTAKSRKACSNGSEETFRQMWALAKQVCVIGKDETLATYLRGWIAQKGASEVHRILMEPRCKGRAILDIQKWYFDGMAMKGD